MTAKLILSKQRIREIASRHRDDDPDVAALAAMAEEARKAARKPRNRRNKRKAKTYLKPTDHLSVEQVGRILEIVQSQADAARANSPYRSRAVLNEMLIVVMLESGLRVSEVCNLRLRSLPSYHGHQALEVLNAKGDKDRTVGISDLLTERLSDYVERYHGRHSIESSLFRSENGGRLSTDSVYCKIKLIGLKARIWIYRKNGRLKTKLSPHKFRHTNATHLLDVTGNEFLVKDQLGHEKTDTTHIYARTLTERLRSAMNAFSIRIWSKVPVKNRVT